MGVPLVRSAAQRSAAQQDKTAPTFRAAALPAQAASRVPHPCLSAGPPARPPEPACRPLVGLLAEFRRAASKEVLREVAPLLKAYQEEVDRLTSRWVLQGQQVDTAGPAGGYSVTGTAGPAGGYCRDPWRVLQGLRGCCSHQRERCSDAGAPAHWRALPARAGS